MLKRSPPVDPRQLDMFEKPRYPRKSPTSKAAAKSLKPATLQSMRFAIVALVDKSGTHGRTCDELERILTMKHQTCSARLLELVDKGFLIRTEQQRNTRSGRKAYVYVVAA